MLYDELWVCILWETRLLGYMLDDLKLFEFFFFFNEKNDLICFLRKTFISYLNLFPLCLAQCLTQTRHSINNCELKKTTG